MTERERIKPTEVAQRLGLNRSTVGRFGRNHGLLGEDGLIDWLDYQRAHEEHGAHNRSADDADQRRKIADAELAELRLAEKRGELKPAADVEQLVSTAIGSLLAGLAEDLEPALREAGCDRIDEGVAALEARIHARRQSFADQLSELSGS